MCRVLGLSMTVCNNRSWLNTLSIKIDSFDSYTNSWTNSVSSLAECLKPPDIKYRQPDRMRLYFYPDCQRHCLDM